MNKTIQEKLADRMYELLSHKKNTFYGHELIVVEEGKPNRASGQPLRLADVFTIAFNKLEPIVYKEFMKDILIGFHTGKNIYRYETEKDDILLQSDKLCELIYFIFE